MLFANQYLANGGNLSYVSSYLYNGSDPETGTSIISSFLILVIKADLDFVAANWQSPGFDLWEEVNGTHFYTGLVTEIMKYR
jgi:glucoamylase